MSTQTEEVPMFEPNVTTQSTGPADTAPFPTDNSALYRAVAALGHAFENISVNAQGQQQALAQLFERISSSNRTVNSGGNVKHRDPRVFNGKADQVEPFLREVNNTIYLQRRSLVSERDKVMYFSFYLSDSAPASWFRTVELSNVKTPLLDNFDNFVEAFKARFRDPDQYASALRKMRKLKQTSSCAAFTNQYIEILVDLDWTEQTKIQEYYDRLKDTVKTTLYNRKGRYFSQDFTEYAQQCIDIDNELHGLTLDTRSHLYYHTSSPTPVVPNVSHPTLSFATPSASTTTAPGFYTPVNTTLPTTIPANPDVVPMEIDALHRGPLSANEKERRRAEHLCLYCGQPDHFVSNCPNKPPTST